MSSGSLHVFGIIIACPEMAPWREKPFISQGTDLRFCVRDNRS
ncbi:MAG TPA: hypothetical protein PLN56_01130 [Methanoregulaceae archaeon]|nr:hypothetical protein [Methanoregulaceae archaeon]